MKLSTNETASSAEPAVDGRRAYRRVAAGMLPILSVVLLVTGCTQGGNSGGQSASGAGSVASASEIRAALDKLPVGKEATMSGYSREKFPHWDDSAEHGFGAEFAQYSKCTSREVMMLRDATRGVTLDPKSCKLTVAKDGGWEDAYGVLDSKTGQLKPYKFMTDPSDVDAEHIVPLAEAWRSGAKDKDENTRRDIANDAVNLEASDPSANRSKGDQDASDYLPPGKFRCEYVSRYIQIKLKYGLSVDTDEQTALRKVVDECVSKGEFK